MCMTVHHFCQWNALQIIQAIAVAATCSFFCCSVSSLHFSFSWRMEDSSSVIVHRPSSQEAERSGALFSGAEEGEEKERLVHTAHALNRHGTLWQLCTYIYWWCHKLAVLMCQLVFCSSEFYIVLVGLLVARYLKKGKRCVPGTLSPPPPLRLRMRLVLCATFLVTWGLLLEKCNK